MNDSEINATAQGMFLYLQEKCGEPTDALAVILCLILYFYENAKMPSANFTIEEFAERFGKDMIHHWNSRTIPIKGTETRQ